MVYLYSLTGILLLASLITSHKKTYMSLKIAYKKLIKILPAFSIVLIFISIVLFFATDTIISKYLGNSNILINMALASFFGSITLMPGFIAFPLSSILLKKGVTYMVISIFTTTLMMVGILTYPIEKEYFGSKVTIVRNLISFVIAIIVAIITGIIYGEIF